MYSYNIISWWPYSFISMNLYGCLGVSSKKQEIINLGGSGDLWNNTVGETKKADAKHAGMKLQFIISYSAL